MLHNFFCVNFEIITKLFRNKDYPFLSTILSLVIYQFFTLLFINDFITFQILRKRDMLMERNMIYGYILISLLIIANYAYFSNNNRYVKIWNYYLDYSKNERMRYRIISYFAMLTIILLTILLVYSIRHNIHWL